MEDHKNSYWLKRFEKRYMYFQVLHFVLKNSMRHQKTSKHAFLQLGDRGIYSRRL